MAALYWKDYLGLPIDTIAHTAAWGIQTLAAHSGARLQQAESNSGLPEPS